MQWVMPTEARAARAAEGREVVRLTHLEQPQDVEEPVWKSRHQPDSRRHFEILIAQHEIKPGLDFCSLLTFNDGAARRQDFELCWSRFV